MIQLFEIKKKVKQMKNTDKELLEKYTETSKKNKEEILKEYNTKEEGQTQKEYEKRYEKNGPNIVVKNEKKSWLEFFIKSFNDKFIYILKYSIEEVNSKIRFIKKNIIISKKHFKNFKKVI